MRRLFIIIPLPLIAVYVIFGFYLYLDQNAMLYHPDHQNFEGCSGFSDYHMMYFNGTRFYFRQGSVDKVLVYYHGNGGSACDMSSERSIFEKSNASLIFVEYTGYSNGSIRPSKDLILNDVRNIREFISEKNYSDVVVAGYSLGSAAASYQAYLGGVDSLVLVSPFSTLDDVAQLMYRIYPSSMLLRDKYDNIMWLKNFHGNLLILHGEDDFLIPYRLSQKLYESIPSEKKGYVLIKGKGHNDIWSSQELKDRFIDFTGRV